MENNSIQEYIQYWQKIFALNHNNKAVVVKEEPKLQKGLLGHFIELLAAPFRRTYKNGNQN